MMNTALEITMQDQAAESLKKTQPKLFDLIDTGIRRNGWTPKKLDSFIANRFGLRRGHIVRELCYEAALSIERKVKAEMRSTIETPQ